MMLLHAARVFPEFAGIDLQSIVGNAARSTPEVACLFDGYAGLFATLRYLAGDSGAYARARATIGTSLAASIRAAMASGEVSLGMDRSVDLIRGVAGVALALAGDEAGAEACRLTRQHLLDVTAALRTKIAAGEFALGDNALNLGVSHGVAGLLAALVVAPDGDSRAMAAVRALADIVLESTITTPHGPAWPYLRLQREPARAAWCYGAPGISCIALETASVLSDASIAEIALASVARIAAVDRSEWRWADYGICHGIAGLALCVGACSTYPGGSAFRGFTDSLVDLLVAGFDERAPYGYRTVMPPSRELADDPGLLTGTAGIGLTLLTLAGVADPSWAQAFGIRFRAMPSPVPDPSAGPSTYDGS
jgi:lantibiotic modifying enzyme